VRATQGPPKRNQAHPDGITIRQGEASDLEAIQTLGTELFRSFADPPIFLPFLPETAAARQQYHADLLTDPACPHWLAFAHGRLVGMQIFVEPMSSQWSLGKLQTPERSIFLHWAGTAPDARGAGIGKTLTTHTMARAREVGYGACTVYYMTASRAATFWQELGFRPIAYWLCRVIDERRTWARG
jgi:GNAT superfamily N-acetyltransferase